MKNVLVKEVLEKKTSMPLNLQFFAEGGDEGNNKGDDSGNDDDKDDPEEDKKQFTQEDVSAIAAKEKNQGRKSAYKELGFKSEKEAKEEVEAYRNWKRSQQTEAQNAKQDKDNAEKERDEANSRALAAEEKLSLFMAGVSKDSVDDVLAIAKSKMSDNKTLDEVLEEMKKDKRYSLFFNSSDADDEDNGKREKGTGKPLNRKKNPAKENIGTRLAKAANSNEKGDNKKKSYYF